MIVVGPDAKRFTNEKFKTRHGKIKANGQWTKLPTPCPMFMIFDHSVFNSGPLYDTKPVSGWSRLIERYQWSHDNQAELKRGWIKSANSISELAISIELDPKELTQSIESWNSICKTGKDIEFQRTKMLNPFGGGPYYAIELSPSMLNTQGGPRRNEHGQIVQPDNTPIPRLYSAGELGSIYSHLYQGTGNIGECFAFGRISARHAITNPVWDL
jgi:succinate dehydrogenase/fumarate reductase flavoprotein subunit